MTRKQYNKAVENFGDNIYAFMLKSVKDTGTAADLCQDSFLKLWEHRKNVNPEKIKSWLFTTSYHLMLNHMRKQKRTDYKDELPEPAREDNHRHEWKEIADMCLELLNEQQKTVLLLRDYEGYAYAEIAEILSMTESQVKSFLFRARTKIKDSIKGYDTILLNK